MPWALQPLWCAFSFLSVNIAGSIFLVLVFNHAYRPITVMVTRLPGRTGEFSLLTPSLIFQVDYWLSVWLQAFTGRPCHSQNIYQALGV